MGQLLFGGAVILIGLAWWRAVYLAPPALSVLMRGNGIVFVFGFAIFALGLGGAGLAVYASGSPTQFVGSLVTAFWGGWVMLAPTASRRSSPEDAEVMERLAIMLMALMAVLLLSFEAPPRVVAGLQLWLVLFGGVVALGGVAPRWWGSGRQ